MADLIAIYDFWLNNPTSKWFSTNTEFDKLIYDKFSEIIIKHRTIYQDDVTLSNTLTLQEQLSLVILFDQLSRNMNRINSSIINRYTDDSIALYIADNIVNIFTISKLSQRELYFVVLPYRHTKNHIYCTIAKNLIIDYEKGNKIINDNEWLHFKCATFRSFYDSTSSHIFKKDKYLFSNINNFKLASTYYRSMIDPIILDINNFESNTYYINHIVYKEIENSISKTDSQHAICISLSGGVDSMCIAHALSKLATKLNLTIHAVHLKHSNRQESQEEAEMICEFCHQLDIIYHQIDVEHIKRGEINRDFYETETRRLRFDFYRSIKDTYGVELFALGHHQGDVCENVFTNMLKGRSLLDLPVMSEFDQQEGITIWRPLLSLPKSDILDYAANFGIIYTKNSTPEWSVRGKLRNNILPALRSMFNNLDQNLYSAANESRDLYDYINSTVINDIYTKTRYGQIGFYFPINTIRDANFTIWKLIIQKIFHSNGDSSLKDHIIQELMKCEKKVINVCKKYVSYCDGTNMIFFDTSYFNRQIETTISDTVYTVYIDLDMIINNNISYTIDANNESDIKFSNIIPKYYKQILNKILPSEIYHKYMWGYTDKKGANKYLVSIKFM